MKSEPRVKRAGDIDRVGLEAMLASCALVAAKWEELVMGFAAGNEKGMGFGGSAKREDEKCRNGLERVV